MNIIFEVHTTITDPITVRVSNYSTLKELYELIVRTVEKETIFNRNDILAIFAQDTISNDTINLPWSDACVNTFILLNRNYFPIGLVSKNTYKLYIIDHMYNEKLKTPDKIPKPITKTINTNYYENLKKFVSFW